MPKDTKTLGNSKARACESLGFVHKKGCARVLTQPLSVFTLVRTSLLLCHQPLFLPGRSYHVNIRMEILRTVS